jgi:serine acetyltransferase
VSIGAGSWLGAGVIVLPGAAIGCNVVVAAGAVVRGVVPDRCVVAGVPARVVREYVRGNGWRRPVPRPARAPAPAGAPPPGDPF